ncbi:MAG: hypothetical protein A2Y33_02270 [Spirochaetes bacterium GWF1_51_8]|nr:MAG: hypothetical protein A2Y33_02270 [Spirochaetes bacterium GWF1_51_8]
MKIPVLLSGLLILSSCQDAGQIQSMIKPADQAGQLDEATIVSGLKEALNVGIKNAVKLTTKPDCFLNNASIKIPIPVELKEWEDKLRAVGLSGQVNDFLYAMNCAADMASAKSGDIFMDAVSKMTVQDANNILKGQSDAATVYLEKATRKSLYDLFAPIITQAMNEQGVTKLYNSLIEKYNAIPLVKPITFNLADYVNNKALDGIFYLLAQEEAKIRKDPAARVTDLLKKVFGS